MYKKYFLLLLLIPLIFVGVQVGAKTDWETPSTGSSTNSVPYTGATQNVDLGSKNLTTTGTLSGSSVAIGTTGAGFDSSGKLASKVITKTTADDYTVGTTNAGEAYGGIIYVTAAKTVTLPAIATGMSVSIVTVGAVAVSVDPNGSDKIVLDGVTTLHDGDKITNTSTAGDIAVCTYYSADGWYCATNSWTDGG